MALILSIDTAIDTANICLASDGVVIASETNDDQKNHGAFLQPAIRRLFSNSKIDISTIDAVAVVNGPGSYTGLRVGLSSAKGLCYALNKPLLTINTLEMLAHAAIRSIKESTVDITDYRFCSLIDARRMEVFTALYNAGLQCLVKPQALILVPTSFQEELQTNKVVFSGNGQFKLKDIISNPNAIFLDSQDNIDAMATIAQHLFSEKAFADLAYCEPFYLKEVYFAEKRKN